MNEKILELEKVASFKLTETKCEGLRIIRVRGLAAYSSLACDKIVTQAKGSQLTIQIFLVPAHKGLSGSFDYAFILPSDVHCVSFGDCNHQIWTDSSNKSSR
jgi:hypothetical protein